MATGLPHAALQVPPEELDAYPAEWDATPYLGQKGYLPHPRVRDSVHAAMGFDPGGRFLLARDVSEALVAPDRLRFDFAHYGPVTDDEIRSLERKVNEAIRRDIPTRIEQMDQATALERGVQLIPCLNQNICS